MTRALMIQGTGSDVGKSLIVAGLARAFADRGLRVRPFKPQNMSNNAAVTADGGEIGRAQALQARAARVAPSVHMNPVLLKPQSMIGAQVVVQGRVVGNADARAYQSLKPGLMAAVLESFARLAAEADLVLVEGAGSAAEVNLRAADIANMGFARAAGVPVVLVGDIDRGGVIAQIVGTHAVIDPADAAMVQGFLVNRFRGDPALFTAGMRLIETRTGWPALGLVPHLADAARLPAEDGMSLARQGLGAGRDGHVHGAAPAAGGAAAPPAAAPAVVAVILLPAIANFDDLDPLAAEPGLRLVGVRPGETVPAEARLVVLPGSKATIADLAVLRAAGLHHDLAVHHRRGGRILGICGGYQMLGRSIADPAGIEGPPATVDGLGFLEVDTVLGGTKRLVAAAGASEPDGVALAGYEMHVGATTGPDRSRPFARLTGEGAPRPDGARSADGRVAGTYLHGLFGHDAQRRRLLAEIGVAAADRAFDEETEAALDAVAAHLARHVHLDRLLSLAALVEGADG